jgi:hypothetical protein
MANGNDGDRGDDSPDVEAFNKIHSRDNSRVTTVSAPPQSLAA